MNAYSFETIIVIKYKCFIYTIILTSYHHNYIVWITQNQFRDDFINSSIQTSDSEDWMKVDPRELQEYKYF